MNHQERETAFLNELLNFHGTCHTAAAARDLSRAQKEERCVRRALKTIFKLTVIACCGFLVTAFFLPHMPAAYLDPLTKFLFIVGITGIVSLVVFACAWRSYRTTLEACRETCRDLLREHLLSLNTSADLSAQVPPSIELFPSLKGESPSYGTDAAPSIALDDISSTHRFFLSPPRLQNQ